MSFDLSFHKLVLKDIKLINDIFKDYALYILYSVLI